MIIDGKTIAAEVLARVKIRAAQLTHTPRIVAFVTSDTPATRSYLSIKGKRAADAGCELEVKMFPQTVSEEELVSAVREVKTDACIVQLPLPDTLDARNVCDAIPVEADADVLSSAARAAFMRGDERALLPPVVGALQEILEHSAVGVRDKKAVIVGSGYLVGQPCAAWLAQNGARVTTVNQISGGVREAVCDADIVVLGAGSPHLVTPEMLAEGVVLIDAGTSESGGVIVGDADPACAEKASVFTPVPGGVGPIAVAKLFENAMYLAERNL